MFDQQPTAARLTAQAAPSLPVDRLCLGRDVGQVRALVPRIFNLCRDAQTAALDAALGHDVALEAATQEVLRDHLLKFFVIWPGLLELDAQPMPMGWADAPGALASAVFGPSLQAPQSPKEFEAFLASGDGVAPVLERICNVFKPGEAVANGLPLVSTESIWAMDAQENSVAARHVTHPVMVSLEKSHGRGPLWRAAARAFDIDAALRCALPPVETPMPGRAIATAARGAYALCVKVTDGRVTALTRVTPTDHLLADGGMLERSLATLPPQKAALGPLVLDILDPCSPVRLREVGHA
jgi:hypothetical protein